MVRGADRGRVAATVAVLAFGLLLLLWGTGDGPRLLRPPQGEAGPPAPADAPTVPPELPATATAATEPLREASPIQWGTVAIALILLAVLVTVLRWLLNRDWESRDPALEEQEVDELALLLRATSEQSRQHALAQGDPRNAVVACWVALEDAADGAGLQRTPAETSAEFTRRVLSTWSVDEATIDELGSLYREARFSRRRIIEHQKDRALTAMESINAQLRERQDSGVR